MPTITTSLSGFGQWINPHQQSIDNGVAIIERTDANYPEAVAATTSQLIAFANMEAQKIAETREKARIISQKAHWENFIQFYYEAYSKALSKKEKL